MLRTQEFRRGQRPAGERGQLQGQLVVDGLASRVADRIGGLRPRGQHVGQLGGLARERMRARQPDIVRCGCRNGRQVGVLGPQAERPVRPDPVNDPHTKLPSDDAATPAR